MQDAGLMGLPHKVEDEPPRPQHHGGGGIPLPDGDVPLGIVGLRLPQFPLGALAQFGPLQVDLDIHVPGVGLEAPALPGDGIGLHDVDKNVVPVHLGAAQGQGGQVMGADKMDGLVQVRGDAGVPADLRQAIVQHGKNLLLKKARGTAAPPCRCTGDLFDDLAIDHAGHTGGVGLVGVEVGVGGEAGGDTDHHIAKDGGAVGGLHLQGDDLLVGDTHLGGVLGGGVDVALGGDDALLDLHLTAGAHQLAAGGAGDIAGFPHRGGDTDAPGVGEGDLHLVLAPAGPQDGDAGEGALGSHDVDALGAGVLPGLGEFLLGGEGGALAEEGLQGLLGHMDVASGSFDLYFGHGFVPPFSVGHMARRVPTRPLYHKRAGDSRRK